MCCGVDQDVLRQPFFELGQLQFAGRIVKDVIGLSSELFDLSLFHTS